METKKALLERQRIAIAVHAPWEWEWTERIGRTLTSLWRSVAEEALEGCVVLRPRAAQGVACYPSRRRNARLVFSPCHALAACSDRFLRPFLLCGPITTTTADPPIVRATRRNV